MTHPNIVAHRGFASRYPENTMVAFEAAISAGVRYLELDVQLSADHQVVIVHDDNLQRTSGHAVSVLENNWSDLQDIRVGEPSRFGEQFADEPLPLLVDFLKWLKQHPDVSAFVEIKSESIQHFGIKTTLDCVLAQLASVRQQCYLISYHADGLSYAHQAGWQRIGWVLTTWDQESHQRAIQLQPDILICNYKKIPDESLWPGVWQWFLYEITDAGLAFEWAERGVNWVETMAPDNLLSDPRFQGDDEA